MQKLLHWGKKSKKKCLHTAKRKKDLFFLYMRLELYFFGSVFHYLSKQLKSNHFIASSNKSRAIYKIKYDRYLKVIYCNVKVPLFLLNVCQLM